MSTHSWRAIAHRSAAGLRALVQGLLALALIALAALAFAPVAHAAATTRPSCEGRAA